MIKRNLLQQKSGFTVTESLIALAIVSVVALSGLGTMSYIRKVKNRSKEVCMAHVSGTLEKFRSLGYFSQINYMQPVANVVDATTPRPNWTDYGLPGSSMYPVTNILDRSTQPPTLNNDQLISGSINALLAIYNSNSGFCNQEKGLNYVTSPAEKGFGYASPDLKNSSLYLKISPYSTQNSSALGCPTPLRISPSGEVSDATSITLNPAPGRVQRSANARTDVGLYLSVLQEYTDEDGVAQSCSVSQRFQYGADRAAPTQPDVLRMDRLAGPTAGQSCAGSANANQYRITVGYQAGEIEAGSVLVCRDLSFVPSMASGFTPVSCNGSGAPGSPLADNGSSLATEAGSTGMNYDQFPALRDGNSNPWVSCDQVRICGVTPIATSVGDEKHPRYSLVYNNLPATCRAYLQVAAVDTGFNSSAQLFSTDVTTNNILEWDVPMTSCGARCGPPWQAEVYYECGGCP